MKTSRHFENRREGPGDEVDVQFGSIPGTTKFVRLVLNVFLSGLET